MKQKFNSIVIGLVFLLAVSGITYIFPVNLSNRVTSEKVYIKPENSGHWTLSGTTIYIDNNWSDTRDTYAWCSGSGTVNQPYIIENLTIDGMQQRSGMVIKNTNDYFEIRNVTILNTTTDWSTQYDRGIFIDTVANGKIVDSRFSYHDYFAVSIRDSSDILVYNNVFDILTNHGIGLEILGSDSITVDFNNMTNGSRGILTSRFSDSNITNNRISHMRFGGIQIGDVLDNTQNQSNYLAHNILTYLGDTGISLSHSNDNLIYNNQISHSDFLGIMIRGYNNRIIKNTILNNSRGISVDRDNNTFYLNYIESVIENARDYSDNKWDNGSIGNYYSLYDGKDANDDGIGDTPYIIVIANNYDNFPIWWDNPVVSLNSPSVSGTFEHSPLIEVSIDEGVADTIWYTIDDGVTNNTISGLSDTIDELIWRSAPTGPIQLKVYVNDSRGYIGNAEVQITKINNAPDLEFASPTINQVFDEAPPTFTVTISDLSPIVGRWYTIDNGLTYYNFTGQAGTINATAWDLSSEGVVTLICYAMDDLGNIGSESITIIKELESETLPEQAIPSYNIYITVGIAIMILLVLIKKQRKRYLRLV